MSNLQKQTLKRLDLIVVPIEFDTRVVLRSTLLVAQQRKGTVIPSLPPSSVESLALDAKAIRRDEV